MTAANEAMRFERLRAQDGKPLLPPPNMMALCKGGGLNPALVDEANAQWTAAMTEMSQVPSYPAEERLFWTAFLLSRHFAEVHQRPRVDPLLRQTLPHLQQARHQQVVLGLMARNLAAMGNVDAAAQMLGQLDAGSEDLQIDTSYRFTTAFVSLLRHDAQTVLSVLGYNIDDVPMSDAYDLVCGVFRAHAHEVLGNHDLARKQLQQLAPTPRQIAAIEEIALATPQISLVQQSLPAVKQLVSQIHEQAITTNSGIKIGRLIAVPMIGSLVAIGASGLAGEVLSPPLSNIVPGVLIAVLTIGIIAITFASVLKGPRLRKRLLQTGVEGHAQLMSVEQTGTRVNDQPMLRLRMLVHLPGQAPYAVVHQEIVAQIRLAQVQPGMALTVRVDPGDRRQMAIMWG
jgi:hypothetical protein